jgi:N-acetylglutamate synthase-like GNAT family acetyltransferase
MINNFEQIGMDKIVEAVKEFKKHLDAKNIPCCLLCGALLGIIREGKLLNHDKDIDVGIPADVDLEDLRTYLIEKKYFDVSFEFEDIPKGKFLWAKKRIGKDIIVFEIIPLYKNKKSIIRNINLGNSYKDKCKIGHIAIPIELIEPFTEIDFYDIKFLAPNKTEEYLTSLYGNWQEEKKFVDWRYNIPALKKGWLLSDDLILIINDIITYEELMELFSEMDKIKGIIPAKELFHYNWRTKEQDDIMISESVFITIRDLNNKIIGLLRIISDEAYIYYITDVMVIPEKQNQGIGSILMNKAIDFCKKNRFMKIFLATPPNNKDYYKRFGFKESMCEHLEIKFGEEVKYL